MDHINPFPVLRFLVIVGLVLICVMGVCGFIILAANGRDIPPALIAVVSAALGSLSSFLVSVPLTHLVGEDYTPKEGK
jgi:RsiW-degrading membrane proteinase PrsW (M82 family)